MKVLIVSRSERKRAWMRSSLGPEWVVREVDNGVDALRRAQTGAFDVVISDQAAEPYGAFGLTRELKLLPDPPAVLILLDRRQDVWLAKWAGADRWLLQPIDPFEVAEVARALATERRAGEVERVAAEPREQSETAGVSHYPR